MGRKWAAHMAGIVTLIDDVLDGAVGLLSQRPLGVPWRPQALRKPSCQEARGTFLSGGQSEWATTTFFGLLRPQFTRPHSTSTTRPNAIRTTYSSRLTRTVKHCSVGCVRLARQQGLMAARRIVLEVDLDKAPWSVSHLRLRLTAATAIPSRRALYPLQTHRSLFSTTSLHQCRHAATH